MDNCLHLVPANVDADGVLVEELPREEVLVRLYGLLASLDGSSGILCPFSLARAADGRGEPHRFRQGCCRGLEPVVELDARELPAA